MDVVKSAVNDGLRDSLVEFRQFEEKRFLKYDDKVGMFPLFSVDSFNDVAELKFEIEDWQQFTADFLPNGIVQRC